MATTSDYRDATAPSWTDREPGLSEAREALSFAWPHVRARWLITLLLAGLLTGVFVFWRYHVPPTYEASIVLRVTEIDFDTETKPPSSGELETFVNEVFLSRSTLLDIIKRHDLYPEKVGPDSTLALEAMHEDLSVRVVQNYFAPERYMDEPVRSARIVVGYAGRTPDQALAVVREISERFSAEQARWRSQAALSAAKHARTAERALHEQLSSVRRRQAEINFGQKKSHIGMVELFTLVGQSQQIEAEIDRMRDHSGKLHLRGEMERERIGMQFEIVDTGDRPAAGMSRRLALTLGGIAAFIVLLPLTALGIGTLGNRIRSERGVERLGMAPLGTLTWPPPWLPSNTNTKRRRS
jgi:hypothetical protein